MEPPTNPAMDATATPPKEVDAATPPNSNPTNPVPVQPLNQPNPENQNKSKKKMLIIGVVIAILVLAAVISFFVLNHSTTNSTNTQNAGENNSQQQAQTSTNDVINNSITDLNDSLDLGSLL